MKYNIRSENRVRKDLEAVDPLWVRETISSRIDALADDPRPKGAEAMKGYRETYRLRVGRYRIIYTVDDSARLISVLRIGHRRNVYRRF